MMETSPVSERSRHRLKEQVIVPAAAAIPGSTVTVGVGSPFIAPLYQGLLRRAALTGVCPGFGRCPHYNREDWSMHFPSSVLYWDLLQAICLSFHYSSPGSRREAFSLCATYCITLSRVALSTSVYDHLSWRSARPAPHSARSAGANDFQNYVAVRRVQWR